MTAEDLKYLEELKSFLIIDDHPIVREGLSRTINQITGGHNVVDEACNIKEALVAIKERVYDLIVLDLKLGDESGIDLLKQLKQEDLKLKILVLSTYPEQMMAVTAIKNGALGYVCKDQAAHYLQEAIVRVSRGQRYISQEVATALVENSSNPKPLSDQEKVVLKGLGCGKATKQIATELGISPKTVSTYRQRICEKAGLAGTDELVKYAVERNQCQK